MKKLVFLANSFHLKKTKSTDFLFTLFARHFDVTVVPHKEAWLRVPGGHYDVLVSFQKLYSPKELEAFQVPVTVVVPMYDDCPKDTEFWTGYRPFQVLSFSETLKKIISDSGVTCLAVQYFPPIPEKGIDKFPGFRGFFWERTAGIKWEREIKKLIGSARPDHLNLHMAGDPGYTPEMPQEKDLSEYNIEITKWFEKPEGLSETLKKANVYFSPRLFEGIGMSFLEAMALGQCVVAPNHPTMNEYINHGENGILYNPDNPMSIEALLNDKTIQELGAAARKTSEEGRLRWERMESNIVEFVNQDSGKRNNRFSFFRLFKVTEAHILDLGRKVKGVLKGKKENGK